jgi:hypothetical protein
MNKFFLLFLFALRAGTQTITMGETNVLLLMDHGNADLLLAQFRYFESASCTSQSIILCQYSSWKP